MIPPISKIGSLFAIALMLCASIGFKLHRENLTQNAVRDIPIEELPYQLGEWQGKDTEGLDVRSLGILKLDRYVRRLYTKSSGEQVLVYLGYWKKQSGDHQAAKHSPILCLPSNGWLISSPIEKTYSFQTTSEPLSLEVKNLVGELNHTSMLFHYWFFSGEQTYTEEWQALMTLSIENFLRGRSDGGIVEISTSLTNPKTGVSNKEWAEKTAKDFLSDFYPVLHKLIKS